MSVTGRMNVCVCVDAMSETLQFVEQFYLISLEWLTVTRDLTIPTIKLELNNARIRSNINSYFKSNSLIPV